MIDRIPAPLVAKEIRALGPWWLASVLVIAADAYARHYRILPIGMLAFVTGTLALGAQSLGHEYTNRTLEGLLAQPCDRRRIFAIKLLVLLPLVLTLGLVGWLCLTNGGLPSRSSWRAGPFFVLPPLLAITVAPWMTMMTQSTLAAVVFTAALPGTLWTLFTVAAALVGLDYDGWVGIWIGGVLTLCAASAILGWRRFRFLEPGDATAIEVTMPRMGRASPVQLRHPCGRLSVKSCTCSS